MATPKIDLEKFNGKNDFNMWKIKMEALLITQGLGDAIEPISKKDRKEVSSSKTPEEAAELDKKAKSIIILSLGDAVIIEVAKEKTIAGLWAKLESIYMTKSLANRLYIKKFTLKMMEGSSLDHHIDEFNKDYFTEYHEFDGGMVMMGNNAMCRVVGISTVKLRLQDGTLLMIKHVRHVPDLKRNLISLGKFDQIGYNIRLQYGDLRVMNGSKTILKGNRKNGVYVLDGEIIAGESGFSGSIKTDNTRLWHLRLGYISEKGLKELKKQGVLGKEKIGNLEWKSLVGNQTGKKVKKLRTDNGLEFYNQQFGSYCVNEGIMRHRRVKFTLQQYELAETMNRTLMEKVGCTLIQSKLPKSLWAEVLMTASYLVNLSPSSALDFKTLFEIWHGKPASYEGLRAIGRSAYAHVRQGKLAPRALKGVFVGYLEGVKGYKIRCTDLNPPKCIISRDVIFNEDELVNKTQLVEVTNPNPKPLEMLEFEVEQLDQRNIEEATSFEDVEDDSGKAQAPQPHVETKLNPQESDYQLTRDRKKRQIKPTKRFGHADLIALALVAAHDIADEEPKTFKEALESSNKKEWLAAMDDEIASLNKNKTWELVKKPVNRRVVGCKWIYKVKECLTQAEPRRFKARLVANGYT
ncbi:Integrase catalytic domain-containing protein [Citrus sinensis]|uniref:Integrase catalytic domain-containing protein n=1 Tax=Citrus sinensis TaxID=2711 RepID=A0ACB8NWS6_CITSI|nr:Integrase catalytic domain-containing protein [Citrus sinensis]